VQLGAQLSQADLPFQVVNIEHPGAIVGEGGLLSIDGGH
jgi:hypothetical protein